ncbi:hypothetical protein ALO_11844 [Acetonema longum DSM 6540]|uniref:Uncharacterized protein n=1 Tax=Acetonema longum DSM 6540 TaxID=1009370 RepID=F7NJV9_9FIRM|nr:hypothetical protein ALO_11844 [Acetonema longum DSM 6540]
MMPSVSSFNGFYAFQTNPIFSESGESYAIDAVLFISPRNGKERPAAAKAERRRIFVKPAFFYLYRKLIWV